MTGDDRWVLPIVVTILAIWYSSLIGLYRICTDLYTREKLSARPWKALTALFVVALAGPIAAAFAFFLYFQRVFTGVVSVLMMGAFACVLYWQRGRVASMWRYVWPVLIVLLTLGPLIVAAIHTREAVVGLLAVIPPLFASYLLRRDLSQLASAATTFLAAAARAIRRRMKFRRWQYDFIEHFQDNTVTDYSTGSAKGKVVKLVTDAVSVTSVGRAIFEHPADQGETVIEYVITGIDPSVKGLRLQGCYGIMEQFKDDDGNVKSSQFPGTRGNIVRFKVRVNQGLLLQEDRSKFGWARIEGHEPILPREGRLTVQLITNNMGDPSWNWAAWADLKLVEWT